VRALAARTMATVRTRRRSHITVLPSTTHTDARPMLFRRRFRGSRRLADRMGQHIAQFAVTVMDYDEALDFYVHRLGFERIEDTDLGDGKRWVRVRPAGSRGTSILLVRAVGDAQCASVGNQTGGRVFVFLETDDVERDHAALVARGVTFVRPPRREPYGMVAVFADLYGNLFDLIERCSPHD
jgi:predicted enzyme related to lactoylglutathione lyase